MLSLDFINNDYEDKKSPTQRVAQAISIDILTGILPQGKQIVEQQLCDKYKMSRTPIREILKRLEADGMINIIPNRGAFVTGYTPRDIDDFLYMKCILYPQCVKWAIERITDEEFSMLEETFAFMEFYTATEDIEKMQKINRGFHAIIYNASHNHEVEALLLKYDFIIRYANMMVKYPANYLSAVLEEHRAIFDAFKNGDSEAGYEAAQIHAYKSMLRRK